MGLFDFAMNPAWRKMSKLSVDRKREAALVVATYGGAILDIRDTLMVPLYPMMNAWIKKGLCPLAGNRNELTRHQKLLLNNESLLAFIKCEHRSSGQLPLLHYLPDQIAYEMIARVARAFMGIEPPEGEFPALKDIPYSSDPHEAFAQLLVRWGNIIGIRDQAALALIENMRGIGFEHAWKERASQFVGKYMRALASPQVSPKCFYGGVKAICRMRAADAAITAIVDFISRASPIEKKEAPVPGAIYGTIIPGAMIEGDQIFLPVQHQSKIFELVGLKHRLQLSDLYLQVAFLMGQQAGLAPPPFAVGQSVSAEYASLLAGILDRRITLTDKQEGHQDNADDVIQALISLCHEGGFQVALAREAA